MQIVTDLQQFLLESNRAGYASGEEKQWVKESDGSTTISFEQGKWKSHDNFFGGEPYGGRIIVTYDSKPYWMMVYYGWVEAGIESKDVYEVLQQSLINMPDEAPFRGPREYRVGTSVYSNSWNGSVERYSGEEKIEKNGVVVYQAHYMGGLVDQ